MGIRCKKESISNLVMSAKHVKKEEVSSGKPKHAAKAVPAAPAAPAVSADAVKPATADASTKSGKPAKAKPKNKAEEKAKVAAEVETANGANGSRDFFSSDAAAYDMPHSRGKLKIVGIVLGAIVALVAALYLAGAVFFMSHFLPGTNINGVDVSWKTPDEMRGKIAATLDDYQLEITGYGCELTIPGKEISYGLDPDQDMLAYVNPWTWPIELFTHAGKSATFAVSYNKQKVAELLDETLAVCNETATDPVDAHLAYDEATDAVVVAPEQAGTKLDKKQVLTDVDAALRLVHTRLELTERDLVAPAVFATDGSLKNAADQVNALSHVNVTLTLGGYPALKINRGNLLDWIVYDDNRNISLNEEAVELWAQEMADKLNTYGTEHTYTRPDGKEITVSGGPAFGWKLDTAALTDMIVAAVHDSAQGEIAIPCESEGAYYNMETGAEWTRYIDIDLAEQHAYFFDEDGSILWESDIISGNVNYSTRNTPTGVYYITRKATNERLRTYEEGKEKPNESTVAYWMPFIGNVYALHDAPWQPDFGGTMYRDGYGSHGCVNLPPSKAAELYNIVDVGTVVVVHW